MGKESAIEWTDDTFNPWRGCQKVSAGCAHCYADRQSKRNPSVLGVWGPEAAQGTRILASASMWAEPLKWDFKARKEGARRKVFCASFADVFEDWTGPILNSKGEPAVDQDWQPVTMNDVRRNLFQLIDNTPHLDWQLVTKRPENIRRMWMEDVTQPRQGFRKNVWLGTTVENQEMADKRIPELLKCRDLSPVLFLSCEPLLGPVRASYVHRTVENVSDGPWELYANWLNGFKASSPYSGTDDNPKIDWVICGGESGPKARPMHPDWARSLRDLCQAAGVPYFFKQWGEYSPDQPENAKFQDLRIDREGRDVTMLAGLWDESDVTMYRNGKKAAGRLLDGVEYSAFPAV